MAERVDKADHYRLLLEKERLDREHADKEIIGLLHDVKHRYDSKLKTYMAKKQNNQRKDSANSKGDQTTKEENGCDGWGLPSNQTTNEENRGDGWGLTSKQTSNEENGGDGWGLTSKQTNNEENGGDGWGLTSNQPASQEETDVGDWGIKDDPPNGRVKGTNNKDSNATAKEDDPWGTSAPPVSQNKNANNGGKKNDPPANQKKQAKDGGGRKSNQPVVKGKSAEVKGAKIDKPANKDNVVNKDNDVTNKNNNVTNKDNNVANKDSNVTNKDNVDDNSDSIYNDDDWAPKSELPVNQDNGGESWVQQIAYLESQLGLSREEAARLKKRNLRLEKDLDHSKTLIRTLREGCSLVEDQAKTFETRHDTIMMSKADLERELIAIKEESSRHITTINKLQKSNEQISKAFIVSVEAHESCKRELDVLQQKYARKLESYQIENMRLSEANSQLRKLIDYMQK